MDHSIACTRGGNSAELVFDQAECRVFGCEDDIAAQCQFDATTIAKTVNRSDHGNFECFEIVESLVCLPIIEPESWRLQLVAAQNCQIDTG